MGFREFLFKIHMRQLWIEFQTYVNHVQYTSFVYVINVHTYLTFYKPGARIYKHTNIRQVFFPCSVKEVKNLRAVHKRHLSFFRNLDPPHLFRFR